MNYFEEAINDIEEAILSAETGLRHMGKPHNNVTQEEADRWQCIIDRLNNALISLQEVENIYGIERSCEECAREHGPNYEGDCAH